MLPVQFSRPLIPRVPLTSTTPLKACLNPISVGPRAPAAVGTETPLGWETTAEPFPSRTEMTECVYLRWARGAPALVATITLSGTSQQGACSDGSVRERSREALSHFPVRAKLPRFIRLN